MGQTEGFGSSAAGRVWRCPNCNRHVPTRQDTCMCGGRRPEAAAAAAAATSAPPTSAAPPAPPVRQVAAAAPHAARYVASASLDDLVYPNGRFGGPPAPDALRAAQGPGGAPALRAGAQQDRSPRRPAPAGAQPGLRPVHRPRCLRGPAGVPGPLHERPGRHLPQRARGDGHGSAAAVRDHPQPYPRAGREQRRHVAAADRQPRLQRLPVAAGHRTPVLGSREARRQRRALQAGRQPGDDPRHAAVHLRGAAAGRGGERGVRGDPRARRLRGHPRSGRP
jgi:hypothetical protein